MSFAIAVAGVVQQASGGGATTAPTGVEIYDSNGGTSQTCLGECITLGALGENALADLTTGHFSSLTGTIGLTFSQDYSNMLNNNSGNITMEYYAYMTATGATSFEWDVYAFTIGQDANSAINTWSATGTAATTQDGTSGLGENATLSHNAGGRGYLMLTPAFGGNAADNVIHKVRGTATNSAGSTQTTQLQIKWEVV